MIHILYVIDQLDIGGAERQLLELVRRLDRNQFLPQVCSVWGKLELAPAFQDAGAEVLSIHKHQRWDLTFIPKLANYIRSWPAHIVQTIMPSANMWGRVSGILAGSPIMVASERAIRPRSDDYWFYRWMDRLLASSTAGFIVNSRQGAAHWQNVMHTPLDKMTVIYNGIDLARFTRTQSSQEREARRKSMGANGSEKLVGVVARLHSSKDIDTFVRAAAIIAKERVNVRFVWIGDGPERGKMEKLISTYRLENVLFLAGTQADIHLLLDALDVFVLTSVWEGLPNAVIEAMAMAKPLVATCVGGVPELVTDGQTGFLVPPSDPEAVAAGVMRLLDQPEMAAQMGLAARAFVEERLSMDRMVTDTQDLYLRLYQDKYKGNLAGKRRDVLQGV